MQMKPEHAYNENLFSIASLHRTFEDLRGDYEASKESRFQRHPIGVHQAGSGADYHYKNAHDFYAMMEVSRDKVRNDPTVSNGVKTAVANVIQGGFTCKPKTPDDAVNDELEDRWNRWAESAMNVDFERRLNFHAFENMALESAMVDGDIFFNPLESGQLQYYEAHRCRTPNIRPFQPMLRQRGRRPNKIVHGVEKDALNRLLRYHITLEDYDGISPTRIGRTSRFRTFNAFEFSDITERPEMNFYHIFHPRRFSQTRGVTAMAPIMVTAGMHNDIQFAKMVQQQIVSYFAIFRKRALGETIAPAPPVITEDNPCDEPGTTGDEERHRTPLQPGAEYVGDPGEEFQGFSPNVPNAEFFDQARLLLTFIATNFDLPLILLLMDASETNFSGWRGAMDQAKMKFVRLQKWLASVLHRNVYEWKVRQFIAESIDLRRSLDSMGMQLFDHEWHLPRWPYLQPLIDTQADILAVSNNLNSPRRIAANKNLEYSTLVDEICTDRELLISCAMDKAAALNDSEFVKNNPDQKVTWREVAHPALPQGLQMTLQANQEVNNGNESETSNASN